MKKILLLSIMLFAVAMTSCEKDDDGSKDNPIGQTLEQKYPEWVNLTKVLTTGSLISNRIPLNDAENWLTVKIENNQAYLTQGNRFDNNSSGTTTAYKYMLIEYSTESTNTLKKGTVYFYDGVYPQDGLMQGFEMDLVNKTVKIIRTDYYFLLKYN